MSKVPRRNSARGVTLIEALVAVALLGITAVAVMGSVGSSLHMSNLAVQRSIATGLAGERLHRVGALPFQVADDHEAYAIAGETVAGTAPEFTFSAGPGDIPDHPDYSRVLTLTYDSPMPGLLRAEVVVTWNNIAQGQKTHAMITYVHPDLERQQ